MMLTKPPETGVDRFVEEQMFEEDLRAVMLMLRPHRNERLAGWEEYRTGGSQFRATISWDPEFARDSAEETLAIPKMADVLEAILVGSGAGRADGGGRVWRVQARRARAVPPAQRTGVAVPLSHRPRAAPVGGRA